MAVSLENLGVYQMLQGFCFYGKSLFMIYIIYIFPTSGIMDLLFSPIRCKLYVRF